MHRLPPSRSTIRVLFLLVWDLLVLGIATGSFFVALFMSIHAFAKPPSPPPALVAGLDRMVKVDHVPGVTVMVFRDDRMLYRADAGNIARDAQLPVASASKWMAAALIMSVVDDGRLSLDEPIGKRLPEFTGEAGRITLRQILSYTSGQGSLKGLLDVRQDPRISLRDSARRIAHVPLEDKPGTVFRYGGPAFQVAGALVELATGETWAQAFDERIARPLGMKHTYWTNPLWPDVNATDVHNPNLQGGVVTTAEDFGRFLTMLASRGVYDNRRVLSKHAVDVMESVQTRGTKMAYVPAGAAGAKAKGLQYALGNWCERVEADGQCSIASSPGALGTYPWIDWRDDVYGIFFMRRRLPLVEKDIQEARDIIVQSATSDRAVKPQPTGNTPLQ